MKNNNRGFSLIELLITSAILGGLTFLTIQLTKQTTKSNVKFQFDAEVSFITSEIGNLLSNPQICAATFPTVTSFHPSHIGGKFYISSDPLAPKQGYGNIGVIISSYNFTPATLPSHLGKLEIVFNNREILKTPLIIKKTLEITMDINGGNISRCKFSPKATADIWSQSHNDPNVSYNGGKVGIGTSSPTTLFEVAGEIKIGDTAATCDSTLEGAQRYHNLKMELCDGVNWVVME